MATKSRLALSHPLKKIISVILLLIVQYSLFAPECTSQSLHITPSSRQGYFRADSHGMTVISLRTLTACDIVRAASLLPSPADLRPAFPGAPP